MPIVKMPDGTQVRFPDDMPREQIRDMIASKFPDAAAQSAPSAPAVPDNSYFADLPIPGHEVPRQNTPSPAQSEGHWQRGMLAPLEIHSTTKEIRPAVPQAAIDVWNA